MIKLGIIGTNWITHEFVKAALGSKEYQLTAVYSRKKESALTFGKEYQLTNVYTDLDSFCKAEEIDVIYIASPNSFHYSQAKIGLQNGKHVISEKPAVSTSAELDELIALAEEKNVLYFEAARNIHEENFKKVKELLPSNEDIVTANFSFMKYSSRFDQVLAGEVPNIFSPKFSGGALMDLGVYLVYAAVAWFGKPDEAHYFARKMVTGVDGVGHIVFRYPTFDVNMMTGKISTSFLPSEIISQNETICLNAVNSIEKIDIYHHENNQTENIPVTIEENTMIEEAREFAKIIKDPQNPQNVAEYKNWLSIAKDVHEIMGELRKQAGITFAADQLK